MDLEQKLIYQETILGKTMEIEVRLDMILGALTLQLKLFMKISFPGKMEIMDFNPKIWDM